MSKKIIDYNEHIKRTQIGKRRRRGRSYTPIYLALILVVIAVFTVLSLTVLFRIKQFDVTGTNIYTPEQIIAATGLTGDENLIRLDKDEIEKRLKSQLLYIEEAKVTAQYPATLKIEIKQAVAYGAVETADGVYVVSESGSVLEKRESSDGLIRILGAKAPEKSFEEYAAAMETPKISFEDTRTEEAYFELIENLKLRGVKDITLIEIKDYLSISFVISDRIRVNVGNSVDIPYKMQYVEKILEEKKDETRYLLINVSSTEKATVRTFVSYEELWS